MTRVQCGERRLKFQDPRYIGSARAHLCGVGRIGSGLQMSGVDALAISADVVRLLTTKRRANAHLKHDAMESPRARRQGDDRVAIAAELAPPLPAPRPCERTPRSHLRYEARFVARLVGHSQRATRGSRCAHSRAVPGRARRLGGERLSADGTVPRLFGSPDPRVLVELASLVRTHVVRSAEPPRERRALAPIGVDACTIGHIDSLEVGRGPGLLAQSRGVLCGHHQSVMTSPSPAAGVPLPRL